MVSKYLVFNETKSKQASQEVHADAIAIPQRPIMFTKHILAPPLVSGVLEGCGWRVSLVCTTDGATRHSVVGDGSMTNAPSIKFN